MKGYWNKSTDEPYLFYLLRTKCYVVEITNQSTLGIRLKKQDDHNTYRIFKVPLGLEQKYQMKKFQEYWFIVVIHFVLNAYKNFIKTIELDVLYV